jgi:hypothetical protein
MRGAIVKCTEDQLERAYEDTVHDDASEAFNTLGWYQRTRDTFVIEANDEAELRQFTTRLFNIMVSDRIAEAGAEIIDLAWW